MTFDICFNCGEPGHFASSCPVDRHAQPVRPASWTAPVRRADQDAINARGVALCRQALAANGAPQPATQPLPTPAPPQ